MSVETSMTDDARIPQALNVLHRRLRTFVEDRLRSQYGDRWLEHACTNTPNFGATNAHLDVQALIRVATDRQHEALFRALSPQGRNYLHELRDVRSRYAHQREFAERDIDRALDTLELFLRTINAPEAEEIALLRKPVATATNRVRSGPSSPVPVSLDDTATGLANCDFVYFATPACGPWTLTEEFVASANAIVAHVYNRSGLRMPLIRSLRPGHSILLVYGADAQYSPVLCCRVCVSPEPVRSRQGTFDVFCYIADQFHARLRAEGYVPDPVIQRLVGISIGSVQYLRDEKRIIKKPKGNNTLRRWDEVFPRPR